jgi:hypothetical protein
MLFLCIDGQKNEVHFSNITFTFNRLSGFWSAESGTKPDSNPVESGISVLQRP